MSELPVFTINPIISLDGTGKKLTDLRKRNGYTRNDLSKILNTTYQTIANWENCIKLPSIDKLVMLSKLYVCHIDDILDIQDFELTGVTSQSENSSTPESSSSLYTISGDLSSGGFVGEEVRPYENSSHRICFSSDFEKSIGKKFHSKGIVLNGKYMLYGSTLNFVDGSLT